MPPLKVVPLSSKSKNSHAWSGEQMVQTFLDDIRAGTIDPQKIMILWFSVNADGRLKPHRWFAQITTIEEVALLELAQHIAIEDWKS